MYYYFLNINVCQLAEENYEITHKNVLKSYLGGSKKH